MVPMTSLPALPGSSRHAPAKLTRKAKAAIVVRLLLNEGADIPLEELPEELQMQLTQQMGAMRFVDRDTLATVVAEFAAELESIGLSFPGGIVGALEALDGRISKQTAARLRKEAGVRQGGDPWERLRALGADTLLPVLQNESIEVAAVLLSKLDVKRAAELLGKLPGPEARRITYAVSLTSAVTPEAVDRIGLSLAAQLETVPLNAFETGPVERVGAIFTFGNIPKRIATRDIPRVVKVLDQDVLVTALAGAKDAGLQPTADFILENMSGRMADQLREAVEERGSVKSADMEEATGQIVQAIRAMESAGELLLIVEDDI